MGKSQKISYVVLVFVLLLGLGAAGFLAYLKHQVEGEYFDSDGVRIHFVDEGSGEPVILIHGFAANIDLNWRKNGIMDALKQDFRVVALDNRGHGLSDKPHTADKYGVNMVEDVIRLMDHLKIPKAHVVGYSMGGFITLKLITTHPDRLLSAAPCAAGWEAPENNREVLDGLVASLEKGGDFGPLIRRLEPGGADPGRLRIAIASMFIGIMNDKMALAQIMKRFEDNQLKEEELRANKVPTISIVGTEDPLKKGIDNMVGVMGAHETAFIEGADHITTLASPKYCKEYINVLRAFLLKHSAKQ